MALTQISTDGIKNGTITGSDLATNVDLVDNQNLRLGTGNDLKLSHDGTDSIITHDTGLGLFRLNTAAGGEVRITKSGPESMARFIPDGAVELYNNGSKKFETQNLGVTVTGGVYPAAADTYQLGGSSLRWNELNIKSVIDVSDNGKIRMGDSDDLEIFHDGTNSRIHSSSHNLYIRTGGIFGVFNGAGSETMLKATVDGAVELYYDNSKKFESRSGGVTVQGQLSVANTASGGVSLSVADNAKAAFGTGDDLKIFHDGTDSRINNSTGALQITGNNDFRLKTNSGQNIFKATGSAVELYFDAGSGSSKKLETYNGGVEVFGDLSLGDNRVLNVGTGSDLQIFHTSNQNWIVSNSDNLYLKVADGNNDGKIRLIAADNSNMIECNNGGNVELSFSGSIKLKTFNSGIITQHVQPDNDNDHDVGSSSKRFDNIHATNGTIQTSDKNEKENILTSDLGLDFINKLKPISFKFKGKTRTHYGLIAQDIETLITDLGKTTNEFAPLIKETIEDGTERYGLRYTELLSPLIKAIQELSAEVAALKAS